MDTIGTNTRADANGALALEFLVEEPGECHVRLTRTASAVA